MLRLSMSENDDHPSLRTETAVSRVGRQRLSACRVRPRERRRHNANPCFAVGPVIRIDHHVKAGCLVTPITFFLSCLNPHHIYLTFLSLQPPQSWPVVNSLTQFNSSESLLLSPQL